MIKNHVSAKQAVKKKQPLLVIESMKMANEICAAADGEIAEVKYQEGDLVKSEQLLITFVE